MSWWFADICTAMLLGSVIALHFATSVSHADLIQRGLAVYCPMDGRFAFVGECEK